MSYAIQAEGLVKNFGETRALAGVDLTAEHGTVLGVLGPNGAGKTTAVRVLSTLLKPDGGHASVCGYDVVHQAHEVRQMIGLTGQYASVDEGLTGTENLVMVARLLGRSRRDAKSEAARMLERFGIAEAGNRAVKGYSGGMRRRLDLAVSLLSRPQVLYLDEPTTGLDPASRGDVWDMVRELLADGVTVLLTTQYLDEADQLADDIAVIDHGHVIARGTAEELKTKVGGQSIDVRALDPARTADVSTAITELTGSVPARRGSSELLSVGISDTSMMPALVRRLDQLGIEIAELSLHRPSLDEVFLTLTGHTAAESEVQSGGGSAISADAALSNQGVNA